VEIREMVDAISEKIIAQWEKISLQEDFTNLCFVLFKSLSKFNNSFKGKLHETNKCPELISYLFYEKSKKVRLIPDGSIIFKMYDKDLRCYINISHHIHSLNPYISFFERDGFDCLVHFATIL